MVTILWYLPFSKRKRKEDNEETRKVPTRGLSPTPDPLFSSLVVLIKIRIEKYHKSVTVLRFNLGENRENNTKIFFKSQRNMF